MTGFYLSTTLALETDFLYYHIQVIWNIKSVASNMSFYINRSSDKTLALLAA